jgi:ABC-2 type transport system permease protein
MKAMLELYGTLLRVSIADMIQYRASGMIWMIGAVLEPVVFLVVWSVAARSSGGELGGQGPHDFAAYYLTLMVVNHVTFSWIMEVFQYRIQYGALSFDLLKPLHPIHDDIASNLAYKLVMSVAMVPAVVCLIVVFEPHFHPVMWSLLCAPPALLLALALRFCLDWTLALCAFWTTRISAVNRMYYSIMMFLSGRAAPIALLPAWLGHAALALPFYYVLAFPIELLLGRLRPEEVARGFCMQLGWLTVAVAALTLVWRFALRRFSAVGS